MLGWVKGTEYETWPGRFEETGKAGKWVPHSGGSHGANINSVSAFKSEEPDTCIQKHEVRPPRGQKLGSESQARGVPASLSVTKP